MHDPERDTRLVTQLVCGVQACEGIAQDAHEDGQRQRRTALASRARERRQAGAVHVVHHQEDLAFVFSDFVDGNDVGVLDQRRDLRFFDELRDQLAVGSVVRVQHLDRDLLREPARPLGASEVDARHAAFAERRADGVAPQALRRGQSGSSDHRAGKYTPSRCVAIK